MTIPNILTLFRILLTPVFLLFLLNHHITWALFVFFLAGLTDGLDGFIARTFHQKSLLGAFLDPIADKILLVSAFVALTWIGMMPYWLTGIVIARDIAIILGASLLVLADVPFEVRPSIAGKITTLLQLITVLATLSSPHTKLPQHTLGCLFIASALATLTSGYQYAHRWMTLWNVHNGRSRLVRRFLSKLLPLWYNKNAIPAFLGISLSVPYLFALKIHRRISSSKKISLRSFTISVGNLTVGGTGKTPFTAQLAKTLMDYGYKVTVVARKLGKTRQTIPEKVHSSGNVGADLCACLRFGDEPLLLASRLPSVWVGKSKSDTAKVADLMEQPDVIIVDDAYQHWRLARDLDIVLFDADLCVGNGYTLPLGPLREPLSSLKRADAIVMIENTESSSSTCLDHLQRWIKKDTKIFHCRRSIETVIIAGTSLPIENLQKTKCLAFAGIAYPERFFSDLERQGITVVHSIPFPDHHFYSDQDMDYILKTARSLAGAHGNTPFLIITTEKDFLKLPDWAKELVAYATLSIICKDEACRGRPSACPLGEWIDRQIKGKIKKGEGDDASES
jgi:tetraacyldisaccharide 4'-kinase/CDP-diacylglycerol--glycerol-3-phosphate 3-phosphatidyltransferase